MRLLRSSLSITFLLFLAITISCKKDPEPGINCGCNGAPYKHFENVDASHVGSGNYVIFETADTTSRLFAVACDADTTLAKSPQTTLRDYVLTGDLLTPCREFQTMMYQIERMSITTIRKK
ncbi:hypothetical protein LXM25_01170 [Dyadobacter sp. LJ53]|uniref:hypothetical protein n=1 Tax=Dyadobacter chenwenxiniae TaxID=2906456 RepID=UPI001F34F0BD|nr:hypothetical protein [Dyadobacter chenwenxiniae]MCF0048645.1 hypothetical protein [Dyadobacter chenwenxiniae]